MKRIIKIINVSVLILIMPLASILGQDKKNEQKIKIIVNDGSGTKVVIDTVLTGDNGPDSLILKDGSVMRLKHPHGGSNQRFFVMSSDKKDGKDISKEVTVISSDPMDMHEDDNGNVMYYRNDRDGNHSYKVISRSSRDGNDKGDMIWVDGPEKEGDDTFTMHISDNESDQNIDKTRFVIAKDGMVVTIEGTDAAKTKDLAKEIEKRLGVDR
jgi:hypothetical protein